MKYQRELIVFFAASFFLPVFLMPQEPDRPASSLPSGAQTVISPASPQLTPSEIDLYKSAPTLIDWNPTEVHQCAFLRGLQPTQNMDRLPEILQRVGQNCLHLFEGFPNVSCDEEVVSSGSSSYSKVRRDFRYIVIREPDGEFPAFVEYRTDLKGNPLSPTTFWDFPMVNSNFVSSFLFMHPSDQRENRFRYFGVQTIQDSECLVVGFAQVPERAQRLSYSCYQGKCHAILVQGLVWIDSQTFQILRVTTWLLAPRPDIQLGGQTSTIDFFTVQPVGTETSIWMPHEVKVDALYRGVRLRNTHQYSNFKLFRVTSTIKP